MIEAHRLHKRFGTFEAVREISLTIQPGEVLALLGPNGAGKTTTVRMLGAILKPSGGWARVGGFDVATEAEKVRANVGILTEYPGLYGRMRPEEYLHFFGSLLGLDAQRCQERAERLLRQFGLWEARHKRLDGYSKGMKQKIALVRALIHDPPILFLDEPTTAMDPQSARTVRDAIGDLRSASRTILLTTHNLNEAEVLADRIAIVSGGGIVAEGTIGQLSQQLLGDALWELKLAHADPQLRTLLSDLVQIEESNETWARYRTKEASLVNPQILKRLAERGAEIISIAEIYRSLEDVYLRIVAEQQGGDQRYANEEEVRETQEAA
jgi:ABC-2 type transport system ATP-binding protein